MTNNKLCNEIDEYIIDEKKACTKDYPKLREILFKKGFVREANMVFEIAGDECGHRVDFEFIKQKVGCKLKKCPKGMKRVDKKCVPK